MQHSRDPRAASHKPRLARTGIGSTPVASPVLDKLEAPSTSSRPRSPLARSADSYTPLNKYRSPQPERSPVPFDRHTLPIDKNPSSPSTFFAGPSFSYPLGSPSSPSSPAAFSAPYLPHDYHAYPSAYPNYRSPFTAAAPGYRPAAAPQNLPPATVPNSGGYHHAALSNSAYAPPTMLPNAGYGPSTTLPNSGYYSATSGSIGHPSTAPHASTSTSTHASEIPEYRTTNARSKDRHTSAMPLPAHSLGAGAGHAAKLDLRVVRSPSPSYSKMAPSVGPPSPGDHDAPHPETWSGIHSRAFDYADTPNSTVSTVAEDPPSPVQERTRSRTSSSSRKSLAPKRTSSRRDSSIIIENRHKREQEPLKEESPGSHSDNIMPSAALENTRERSSSAKERIPSNPRERLSSHSRERMASTPRERISSNPRERVSSNPREKMPAEEMPSIAENVPSTTAREVPSLDQLREANRRELMHQREREQRAKERKEARHSQRRELKSKLDRELPPNPSEEAAQQQPYAPSQFSEEDERLRQIEKETQDLRRELELERQEHARLREEQARREEAHREQLQQLLALQQQLNNNRPTPPPKSERRRSASGPGTLSPPPRHSTPRAHARPSIDFGSPASALPVNDRHTSFIGFPPPASGSPPPPQSPPASGSPRRPQSPPLFVPDHALASKSLPVTSGSRARSPTLFDSVPEPTRSVTTESAPRPALRDSSYANDWLGMSDLPSFRRTPSRSVLPPQTREFDVPSSRANRNITPLSLPSESDTSRRTSPSPAPPVQYEPLPILEDSAKEENAQVVEGSHAEQRPSAEPLRYSVDEFSTVQSVDGSPVEPVDDLDSELSKVALSDPPHEPLSQAARASPPVSDFALSGPQMEVPVASAVEMPEKDAHPAQLSPLKAVPREPSPRGPAPHSAELAAAPAEGQSTNPFAKFARRVTEKTERSRTSSISKVFIRRQRQTSSDDTPPVPSVETADNVAPRAAPSPPPARDAAVHERTPHMPQLDLDQDAFGDLQFMHDQASYELRSDTERTTPSHKSPEVEDKTYLALSAAAAGRHSPGPRLDADSPRIAPGIMPLRAMSPHISAMGLDARAMSPRNPFVHMQPEPSVRSSTPSIDDTTIHQTLRPESSLLAAHSRPSSPAAQPLEQAVESYSRPASPRAASPPPPSQLSLRPVSPVARAPSPRAPSPRAPSPRAPSPHASRSSTPTTVTTSTEPALGPTPGAIFAQQQQQQKGLTSKASMSSLAAGRMRRRNGDRDDPAKSMARRSLDIMRIFQKSPSQKRDADTRAPFVLLDSDNAEQAASQDTSQQDAPSLERGPTERASLSDLRAKPSLDKVRSSFSFADIRGKSLLSAGDALDDGGRHSANLRSRSPSVDARSVNSRSPDNRSIGAHSVDNRSIGAHSADSKSANTQSSEHDKQPEVVPEETLSEEWGTIRATHAAYADALAAEQPDRGIHVTQTLLPFVRALDTQNPLTVPAEVRAQQRVILFDWLYTLIQDLSEYAPSHRSACLEAVALILEARLMAHTILDDAGLAQFRRAVACVLQFAIDKLNEKAVYANTLIFAGKALAIAFFRIDGVALRLLRALPPVKRATLKRILNESHLDNVNLVPELDVYETHLHALCLQDLRAYCDTLMPLTGVDDGPYLVNEEGYAAEMAGNWLIRWTASDSDLPFAFYRAYHRLLAKYLVTPEHSGSPVGVRKDTNLPAMPTSPHEFLPLSRLITAPGFLFLSASLLTKCDALVHRNLRSVTSIGNSNEPFNTNDSANINISQKPKVMELAHRRIVSTIVDIVGNGTDLDVPGRRKAFGSTLRVWIAAVVKRTNMYDVRSVFLLFDLLDGIIDALTQNPSAHPKDSVAAVTAPPESRITAFIALIDVPFLASVVQRIFLNADNTITLMRTIAFVYAHFELFTLRPHDRSLFVFETVLSNEVFTRLYLHWNAGVRGYFVRLLIWRVARLKADQATVLHCLALLNARLVLVKKTCSVSPGGPASTSGDFSNDGAKGDDALAPVRKDKDSVARVVSWFKQSRAKKAAKSLAAADSDSNDPSDLDDYMLPRHAAELLHDSLDAVPPIPPIPPFEPKLKPYAVRALHDYDEALYEWSEWFARVREEFPTNYADYIPRLVVGFPALED